MKYILSFVFLLVTTTSIAQFSYTVSYNGYSIANNGSISIAQGAIFHVANTNTKDINLNITGFSSSSKDIIVNGLPIVIPFLQTGSFTIAYTGYFIRDPISAEITLNMSDGYSTTTFKFTVSISFTLDSNNDIIEDYGVIFVGPGTTSVGIANNNVNTIDLQITGYSSTNNAIYITGLPLYVSNQQVASFSIQYYINCNEDPKTSLITLNMIEGNKSKTFHFHAITHEYIDYTNPTITCPSNITVNCLPGKNYAIVNYSPPVVSDVCGNRLTYFLVSGIVSGGRFPVGTTINTYKGVDESGNYKTCAFYVTVVDNERPQILNCPVDSGPQVYTDENGTAVLPDFTGMIVTCDNNNGAQFKSKTQLPVAGSIIDTVTEVKVEVSDYADNTSQCSFNVSLVDTLNPVIENPGNKIIELGEHCYAALPDYTDTIKTSDNCDTLLQLVQYPPEGTIIIEPVMVTVAASDDSGNRAETSFTVSGEDKTEPLITCPGNQLRTVNNLETSYIVECREFDPVSVSDNCSYTLTNDYNHSPTLEGAEFIAGPSTRVNWTITDKTGNAATCGFDASISQATDLKKLEVQDISVYPNPSAGLFSILVNREYVIKIIDVNGIVISSKLLYSGNNQIDMSSLPPGNYFVEFNDGNEVFCMKIVLSR